MYHPLFENALLLALYLVKTLYLNRLNMPPQPTPKSGGLSLYANLLDPASESSTAPGTIAKAPVLFTQSSEGATDTDDTATDKQQKSAGSALPFLIYPR